ncbi:hypothetical protein N8R00_02340 [Enterobacter hormaechei subsp. steigerwaltii]|nr:hypothetical protein [Enterobacter hormaechei subsp. steigerwaltii]
MATQPTNLPVPSESPRDLKFNAGKIDEFVTSLVNTYVDRFGNEHYTIEGLRWLAQQAIAQYGWILIDSFQDGADITLPNQALRDEATGEYYRWDGDLPKHVDAGSTPTSTGGVGVGAWIGIGDSSLRGMLASKDGYSLIGELQSVADFNGMTGVTGKNVRLKGWYVGSTIGGGEFYFDATVAKSKHDGGKYISPTVPYTTAQAFVAGTGETDSAGLGVWVRQDVGAALLGEWYGMLAGTVATPMLAAMAKTTGTDGHGAIFPQGTFILSGATVNFSFDNSATGQTKFLKGSTKRGTIFSIDVTTMSSYGISVTGSIGAANATHDMVRVTRMKFRGTGTRATGNVYTGFGLHVQNCLGFHLEDINTENLERDLTITNSLYGLAVSCRFQSAKWGVLCRRNSLTTGVNAMTFLRCDFNDNAIYCVQAIDSHNLKFDNCTFEGNGGKLDNDGTAVIAGIACVQTDTVGAAGGVGAVFDTCYFEGNAFIDVKHIVNTNRNQLTSIRNCIFNKTRSDMTGPRVQVVNTTSGMTDGIKNVLLMQGNKFLSGTNNADATYPDVEIAGFTVLGRDHCDFLDYDNTFTANTKVAKDTYAAWKKSSDDGFICRGLSAGGFSSATSRNVISCTRQGTGVYRVVTNQLTTAFTFMVQLDNAGFATISTSESNEAVTISVFDGAGVAADRNFRLIGKLV